MEIFKISDIIKVNPDSIIYLNTEKQKTIINLFTCRSNWVSHVNTSDNFIDWEGNPIEAMTEEQSKYVGRRDWFDNNPYYEFFTDPIIRFEIITRKRIIELFNKYWKMRYYKEFRFVEEELNRNGWATFDMG